MGENAEEFQQTRFDEITLEDIRNIEQRSYEIIDHLRSKVFAPDSVKELRVTFNITEVAEMVGRTAHAIREAENNGRLPKPDKNEKGRRVGYTLQEVNRIRAEFGTLPYRSNGDEPLVMAVQNFKGGVGKSTIACHVAQSMALRGYRVCIVDLDPQGSSTILFGINPDFDLDENDTLFPFLMHGGKTTLDYALRDTYWDGIKIIPSNLSLYNAEYTLAAKVQSDPFILNRLGDGIHTISDQFDIIIIDPPPALGMISLSVLRAANALIIPVPAATVDFSSTAHFFSMLVEALEVLEKHGLPSHYKFLKVLASKVSDNKSAQVEITKMMKAVYQNSMLQSVMKDSAEIDNSAARLMTVYELDKPVTSKETHSRCKAYLNNMNDEIELLIRKTWPSHAESLRKQGLI